MEEVANASSAASNPAPAPAPVQAAPAAAPAAPATPPSNSQGGSFMDVLKKDAVHITFGILGATALFYLT